MAYYFLTASKDATIYLQQPNQNTGLDEILEISKVYYGNIKDTSRPLIQFDLEILSASLSNNSLGMADAKLILKQTESEEIPLEYTIYVYPISGSWEMGKGTRFDAISTTGATWNYREGDSKLEWLENGYGDNSTSNPNDGTGATWYTLYSSSQYFNYQTADIEMNVKNMIQAWISGSIPNNGLILKYSNAFENNTSDYGILKFFSKETHTIYQPKIRIGWDDQSYATGSLTQLTAKDIKVGVTNLKKSYKVNSIAKLRIFGRELYPLKTFSNSFSYSTIKYLPKNSYYQIRDFASNDVIVPFSEYSKLNCDTDGNYILLNLSNWEADRVYKIEFKVDFGQGEIQYFDDELTFNLEKL